jgi:hypothetical protein
MRLTLATSYSALRDLPDVAGEAIASKAGRTLTLGLESGMWPRSLLAKFHDAILRNLQR